MTKPPKATAIQKPEEVPGTGLLSKALNILECIGEAEGRPRIKEIADATGYSKPTLYRILSALSARDFVQVDPRDHAYALGPKFTELAGAIAQHSDLISVSAAPMKRIADKYGEAVSLGVLAGNAQQTIALRDGGGVLASSPIGTRKPLYCTALGKALLGFQTAADTARLLHDISFEPLTRFTHTSEKSLRADLAAIRMRGFALDNEEILEGAKCVAVPILNSAGQAVAALSVSAPAHRMTERRRHEIALELTDSANAIGTALGGALAQVPAKGALPDGLSRMDGLSGFAITQFLDLADGSTAICDGPGGVLYRRSDNGVDRIASFVVQVRGVCLTGDAMLIVAGDALWRLPATPDPDTATPVKLAEGVLYETVEGLINHGDRVFAAAGSQLLRLDADGQSREVFSGRLPGTGVAHGVHGPLVATPQGVTEVDPETGKGTLRFSLSTEGLRAFAIAPDGGLWIARHEQWSLERLDALGRMTDSLPVPVPTVSALHFAQGLLVGTERWPLSSAQLDLAPLAGSLFILDPARLDASDRPNSPRKDTQ